MKSPRHEGVNEDFYFKYYQEVFLSEPLIGKLLLADFLHIPLPFVGLVEAVIQSITPLLST